MKYKKVFVIFISIMFSLGLAGCSRQEDAERTEYTEEVKIPMLLTIDPSTGNKNEEDVITAFNEEYKGRYGGCRNLKKFKKNYKNIKK